MTTALVSYAPSNLAELEDWAKRYAAAGMFGRQWQNKPMDAVIAIMWGSELGIPTIAALNSIAVISGKPTLYGDHLVGLARRSGKIASIREGFTGKPYEDGFEAWCEVTRVGGDIYHQTFSVADAKRAKLWGKAGPWSDYPRRMLQIRPRTFAVRDAVPELGLGPSAEEMHDVEDEEQRVAKARDVTPGAAGPRQHENGKPFSPHEEVEAAIGEKLNITPEELAANRSARTAERAADAAADPLGINGAGMKKAVMMLTDGFVSARTAADASDLYDAYRTRILKLPEEHRLALTGIVTTRIEHEAEQRSRGESEEFADLLADEAELIGPDE